MADKESGKNSRKAQLCALICFTFFWFYSFCGHFEKNIRRKLRAESAAFCGFLPLSSSAMLDSTCMSCNYDYDIFQASWYYMIIIISVSRTCWPKGGEPWGLSGSTQGGRALGNKWLRPMIVQERLRVPMGWWLLRLSAKTLPLLRLSVNFFQLRLTKKLKINFFCFKKLNIN